MPFRYARFQENLSKYVDAHQQDQIINDLPSFIDMKNPTQKACWINDMINNLSSVVGVGVARKVMEACGLQCIGKNTLKKAQKIKKETLDIDDLLKRLNADHIGGGNLKRDGNRIYASYTRCYCGSVSKTRQTISLIYCQCSCGWYKKIFESLMEKPVHVELIDSIIHGADTCQFIIHI